VWQLLHVDCEAAKLSGRVAFTFVDLTAKDVIPLWIPPDAVGGKSVIGGDSEWTLDAGGLTGTIGALSTALRQATASPRFFRSLNQWTASFMRYAIVAEALGQVKRVWVLNHLLLIQRIAEEQRIADDGNPYLALVYDEMRRKSWAQCGEKGFVPGPVERKCIEGRAHLSGCKAALGASAVFLWSALESGSSVFATPETN
jgi:hypothetical protein